MAAALARGETLAREGIEKLRDEAYEDLATRIARLGWPGSVIAEELYADAHDIRAVAATFGFRAVGAAADALCRYLESLSDDEAVDRPFVDLIVAAMRCSFSKPADPLADEVAASCHKAVDSALEKRKRPAALD